MGWLSGICLRQSPSESPWQRNIYVFPDGSPIMHWPVQSIITSHCVVKRGSLTGSTAIVNVDGVAYAGGPESESSIATVEVSGDGGKTWNLAKLEPGETGYAWTLWRAVVPV